MSLLLLGFLFSIIFRLLIAANKQQPSTPEQKMIQLGMIYNLTEKFTRAQ